MKAKTKTKAKKKKQKLSVEELAKRKLQRQHKNDIRSVFQAAGFVRVDHAADQNFTFEGATSDFDDIFILENVIVLTEYTVTKESDISSHIKPKYILYEKINKDNEGFVSFAKGNPLNLSGSLNPKYGLHTFKIIILYCSYNTVKNELKAQVPFCKYMDYNVVRYMKLLTQTVRASAKSEILSFLGVKYDEFADRALQSNPQSKELFQGSILPEPHSNFPAGYKVVSFYIHPAALLSRAYVLRRDGWRDRNGLYQRMIIRNKVDSIRRHLLDNRRVFLNNIIVTLPSGTKVVDDDENTIPTTDIKKTCPARIMIPYEYNSIGIVDGQHRILSYYEGGANDGVIAELREQQNLLVTGIIYPEQVSAEERTRFEAGLFLEINANQANAKSDLKQAINQILRPFTVDAIARDVLDKLNGGTGPLSNKFAQHYFETDLLKTTSIVSYGLRHLVRPSTGGALFHNWNDEDKETFVAQQNDAARERYIKYCYEQIDVFFSAVKARTPSWNWTAATKKDGFYLTPTIVNGLIGAMRHAMDAGYRISFEEVHSSLKDLESFSFSTYKSSQYTVMATHIYEQFFKAPT